MCRSAVPTWVSPIKDDDGRWITSHVINQDIVAWVGQGAIADRTQENLRSSDIGITMMRNRFFEEIEAIKAGRDPKGVIRDPKRAQAIELPDMARELNTDGITLAEFQNDPLLRQRLKEFRHHYGQPPEVRAAFAEAMGISFFGPWMTRRCITSCGRRLQDRRQPRDLAVHQRGQRLRPAPARLGDLGAETLQPLAHGGLVEPLVERLGELVDDRLRRALGREHRVERRAIELRQALLDGGRHVRQQRAALLGGDGERLGGAGAHMRQRPEHRIAVVVDLAGEDGVHRRRGAGERHHGRLDADRRC